MAFNSPARTSLMQVRPRGTTLHFTFGSAVMMDFVKNWIHFARKAGRALADDERALVEALVPVDAAAARDGTRGRGGRSWTALGTERVRRRCRG